MGRCYLTWGPQPVSLWWSRGVGWEWGRRLKRELIYIIMTDLHCTAEVNTALQSNYPSIKKKNCHVITFLLKIHRGSWGIDIPWTRSVQFQRPSHSNASGAGGWWSFWLWGAAQCLQLSLAVWLVPSLSSETILRFQTCSHSPRSQAPGGFLRSPHGVNREQVDVIRCEWFSIVAGLLFNYFASEWCWVPMLDHLWDIWIIMLHPQWLLTSFEMECFYGIII